MSNSSLCRTVGFVGLPSQGWPTAFICSKYALNIQIWQKKLVILIKTIPEKKLATLVICFKYW